MPSVGFVEVVAAPCRVVPLFAGPGSLLKLRRHGVPLPLERSSRLRGDDQLRDLTVIDSQWG